MGSYALEWHLAGEGKIRGFLLKFPFLLLLVVFFLVVYYPGGVDGYLSYSWKVTLFLKKGVSSEKGAIFAKRLGRLSFIRSAEFHSEEKVWKEFTRTLTNPGKTRKMMKSPLPSLIDLRLKRGHIDEQAVSKLNTIVKEIEIADDLIYGEKDFHKMVRVKKYLNTLSLLSAFIAIGLSLLFFIYVDSALLVSIAGGLMFIETHGLMSFFSLKSRVWGSLLEGGISAACACIVVLTLMYSAFDKFPALRPILSFPDQSHLTLLVIPSLFLVILVSLLFSASSLIAFQRVMGSIGGENA